MSSSSWSLTETLIASNPKAWEAATQPEFLAAAAAGQLSKQRLGTWLANDRLYIELMAHARARGCTRFDFGRSKSGTGAAAFKKNWGFAPEPLVYARRSRGEARRVNPQDERYRAKVRAWQRLPLSVATAVGPWLARGLG